MAILLDPQRPLAYGGPHTTVQPCAFDLLPFSQHGFLWELLFRHSQNTSSPVIMLALALVGSPMGGGQGLRTLLPAGRKAQRHKGTGLPGPPGPPGNQPPGTLGTLGPPRKGSHGGSGLYLLRFRRGTGNIVTSF